MQPQKTQLKKEKSKKITIQGKGLLQLLQAQERQKIKQQMIQKIKPLSFKNKDQLQSAFKQAVSLKYYGNGQNKQQTPKQKISQVLHDIQKLNIGLKQCQVSSPIVDVFNHTYYQLLSQCLQNGTISKKQLIQLWQIIPARDLYHFIQKLCLLQQYKNLNKQKFLKTLISLLADNKIQQVCCYYKLNPTYPQFEQQILLPKILITDQIYTPAIIQLLQIHTELKYKVIQNIDLAKAVIILQHLSEDPRLYDNVNKFILRKHYKSMCHEYSQWYIFQDKMSFNKQFIQWYCQQQQLHQQIKQSIKYRNAIQNKYNKQIIINPLYQFDSFIYSEFIFKKFQHQHYVNITPDNNNNTNNNTKNDIIKPLQQQYAQLSQYNITQQHIYFVHDINTKQFAYMTQILLQHSYLGFDAQYRCTSTKYQQLGVALIQISTGKQIFLIDFISLQNNHKFIQFFKRLLSDPKIFIVGHSVQSDIKFIERTMKIQGIQGIIDIAKIFKQKFPNQTQNSLAFMTYFMTGKQLSKYQQRSNWNRRPLKKSQIHYAALDAQICLILYQMLKDQQIKHTQAIVKNKKVTIEKLIRKQNIVYKAQHQLMLSDARPKFLIDSMLKRLCSLLRNLGIDAQYMAVSNYQLIQQIAKKQNRIILTRDRKLLNKKSPVMPIYCISQKGDSDLMLQQIKKQFNLDYSLFVPLSRCVKCNCSQIQLISTEQALKYVNFQYEDSKIKQFWRCMKCRQVYWQGNQWKNAKKKFQGLG